MKLASLALVAAVLTGCASKPPMPEDMYEQTSTGLFHAYSCVHAGHVLPDVGTSARLAVWEVIKQYTADTSRIQSRAKELIYSQLPPKDVCQQMAAFVQRRAEVARSGSGSSSDPYRPTFTTCNKVFGQVNCTSF